MSVSLLIAFVLLFCRVLSQSDTTSSKCPETSVVGIPGCWGTPGCNHVIAKNIGPGALCQWNYCNCGGTAAPLLSTIISGSSTVGCNYPTQPVSSDCGIALEPIPTSQSSDAISSPSGATVITGTVEDGSSITQTFVLTTYTEYSTLTAISTLVTVQTAIITSTFKWFIVPFTTTIQLPIPITSTITVGPSGIAWFPLSISPGSPQLPPPTALPGGTPSASSSSRTEESSPSLTSEPITSITELPQATSTSEIPLPLITLLDTSILTLTTINPSVSGNTLISTGDESHPTGLYPFIHGGPECFFCPPGVENGGFILWGMSKPGVYPPPVPPPVPSVEWPTITIGPDSKPTPGPKPSSNDPKESGNPEPDEPKESDKPSDDPKETSVTGEPQESEKSESCTTTTASSCAVSCTTASGQSTESCVTVKCETTSGCSVTDTTSTTTKARSCGSTKRPNPGNADEDPSLNDSGEQGPEPSYDGPVPGWVTAWPSETGTPSSRTSEVIPATTADSHPFCVPYQNPSKGESYCTCDDKNSRSFLDDEGNCPSTSGIIPEPTPEPTPEPPKTDGNGNVWNSTDLAVGTIWGCKSTSIVRFLAPVPITMCLSSSSIGMAFTPTPVIPEPTPPPAPQPGPQGECDECSSDMGASSCPVEDPYCLLQECGQNEHCRACNIDCLTFTEGDLRKKRDVQVVHAIIGNRPKQMSNKLSRRYLLETSTQAYIDGFNSTRPILKRVVHGPKWVELAPKGLRYYRMLQDKPMEDAADPPMSDLDRFFDHRMTKPLLPKNEKKDLLEKAGITFGESFYALTAVGPVEGQSGFESDNKTPRPIRVADFSNTLSAEHGVFFANANKRGQDKEGNGVIEDPIDYHMSTIAWWMWKKTVMASQAPAITEADTDFSNFNYFFRINIDNCDTLSVLIEAMGDDPGPKDFTPEDNGPDNAFWPILGSPNGNGIVWFLADHKKSLKGKEIEKITVWRFDDGWHFWATIR